MNVLIGITTRNRAEILRIAILSALAQDYPHKQVAVFDDASTDDTPALRDEFPQVRWYRVEESQGYLPARNRMMRDTDADLYFSLDDDSWFMSGDEISRGVCLLRQRSEVAAVAYDILTPSRPDVAGRSELRLVHTVDGCGSLVRLSAARDAGLFIPNPGFYGGEENDLCLRLLERGHEIVMMPGVHVWHQRTMIARDVPEQWRSGVCNDLVFALRRCPWPMVLWFIPGKIFNHLRYAVGRGLIRPYVKGIALFLRSLPALLATREAVRPETFREFRKRSRGPMQAPSMADATPTAPAFAADTTP
jgi:GT2 family glycosyltransferase